MADQNARLGDAAQVELAFHIEQVVQHARRQVAHVAGPFAQILVVHARQRGGVTFGHLVKGGLGVELLLRDHADDLVHQHPVLQHEQMRFKNIALLGAHVFDDLALHLGNLLAGLDQRFFKPGDLRRDLRVGQFVLGDDVAGAVQDENFPATNAGGNGNAAKQFFSPGLR